MTLSSSLRSLLFLALLASASVVFASHAFAQSGNPMTTNPGSGSGNPMTTNPAAPGTGSNTNTNTNNSPNTHLVNPLNKIDNLDQLLDAIVGAIVKLGGVILTLALVYTGFLFVAAQGNSEKLSGARTALMWTIIGGLILLGAAAIEAVISSTVQSLKS